MPHGIFDVVAEDPEKEHVARDVADALVHEHAREHRDQAPVRVDEEARRDEGECSGEGFGLMRRGESIRSVVVY